ncbi:hypothetical protein MKW92_024887 [Papaver armeniacum]|nr:hypothetical protein MKW92_024887 [Papaver armeniacum]
MSAFLHAGFLTFTLELILLPVAFIFNDHHYLTLEIIIPNNHDIELNELKNRDRTRHGRILQSSIGVVDFSVQGAADPYTVGFSKFMYNSIWSSVVHTAEAVCRENSQYSYQYQYGDGSGTSGFYVSYLVDFDIVTCDSLMSNSSAPVLFGCSNYLSGGLTETDSAVDRILGFG